MTLERETFVRPFAQDVYLYDLNRISEPPIAHRCATGGMLQPTLPELLEISVRDWATFEERLYSMPLCLAKGGGAIVLPVFDSVGRFALVCKPQFALPVLASLAQGMLGDEIYVDADFERIVSAPRTKALHQAEGFLQELALLRVLLSSCEQAENVFLAQECISLASRIWGVELMPDETVEFPPMQEQYRLPAMQLSGATLAVSLMVLLSVMRNFSHARSGWLYATTGESGVLLHAVMRIMPDADTQSIARLQKILEDAGVVSGMRTFAAPIQPPKQYAYMHRKITDPRHPFCARCGCLDKRCADCMILQMAILPYVCDAALLGIKDLPYFSE